MEKMDLKFLRYSSQNAVTHLHPLGKKATTVLINKLDIKDNEYILEVGCGTGGTLIELASRYNINLFGVDILPEMLEIAKKRISLTGYQNKIKLKFVKPDEILTFNSMYFDKIFCESVLGFQYEKDLDFILGEINRVLKKGGIFIANESIWKVNSPKGEINKVNQRCLNDFGLVPATEKPYDINEWKSKFEEFGFKIIEYDLLNNMVNDTNQARNIKVWISNLFTRLIQFRNLFIPNLNSETKKYRELLRQHKDDGKYLESRLFVLEKIS